MKKKFIKSTILGLMLVATITQGNKVFAAYPIEYTSVPLSQPAAVYASIGSYVKGVAYASPLYNCLGYAVNFPGWLWPWHSAIDGSDRPGDITEVTSYLNGWGYNKFTGPYQPQVMAYGENLPLEATVAVIS